MKKIMIIIGLYIVQMSLVYGIFIYMTKELNPIDWTLWFRISFGAISGLILMGVYNNIIKLFDFFEKLKAMTEQNTLLKEENKLIQQRLMLKEKEGKLIVEENGKESTK